MEKNDQRCSHEQSACLADVFTMPNGRDLEMLERYQALQHEIEKMRRHETKQLIACIVDMLMMYGVDLADVEMALAKRQHSVGKASPRYMDPISGKTWGGKGRRPLWMGNRDPGEFLLPQVE